MSGTASKEKFFKNKIKIGTHDAFFHADDAFACYMLRKIAKGGAEIVRTRNLEILATCDIVVDVGDVYSHEQRRYDHHQRGFNVRYEENARSMLSSAGLIYKHYGKEVLMEIIGATEEPEDLDKLYSELYYSYIYAFDCMDTGVDQYQTKEKQEYNLNTVSIFSHISRLYPTWSDKNKDEDAAFVKAMDICGVFFELFVQRLYFSNFPARKIVEDAFNKLGKEVDEKIFLLERNVPYSSHLHWLEKKHEKEVLYAVTPRADGAWTVRAINKKNSFESRLPLQEKWRGLRDSELEKASGIEGTIFVHHSGFTGAAKTKQGAIRMAEKTIEESRISS
ncbi:MAG: GAMM1 protein [Amphiamblys sp. WSBS2006]|nr:MAG: GAMM1 protein [Amphiamblys sp. WSBS2006]